MISSPGLIVANSEAIIPSVEPQQTVTSVSGSNAIPVRVASRAAIALRRFFDPQVMLYWFTSASMARIAAALISDGAEKSGKPCERFTALCNKAWRVISRITDSVNCNGLEEIICLSSTKGLDLRDVKRDV